jgi:NAD(P)-dependent dehydrogenase (short-subunit alcohol dehydrogenase family)
MPGAILVGAGPGVGTSVARRLAREGLTVGVIARTEATVDDVLSALSDYDALGVTADVTDDVGLRAALDEIVDRLGTPELLVYIAALIRSDTLGELAGWVGCSEVSRAGPLSCLVGVGEPRSRSLMMRVFVAGATGAIGRQLLPLLVASGHEVHGMTRSESKRASLYELGAVPGR